MQIRNLFKLAFLLGGALIAYLVALAVGDTALFHLIIWVMGGGVLGVLAYRILMPRISD